MIDLHTLGAELVAAYAERRPLGPHSRLAMVLDLTTAYAVEGELVRMRRAAGRQTAGVKVGFADKAVWKIEPGATWTAPLEGLDLPNLTLSLV